MPPTRVHLKLTSFVWKAPQPVAASILFRAMQNLLQVWARKSVRSFRELMIQWDCEELSRERGQMLKSIVPCEVSPMYRSWSQGVERCAICRQSSHASSLAAFDQAITETNRSKIYTPIRPGHHFTSWTLSSGYSDSSEPYLFETGFRCFHGSVKLALFPVRRMKLSCNHRRLAWLNASALTLS